MIFEKKLFAKLRKLSQQMFNFLIKLKKYSKKLAQNRDSNHFNNHLKILKCL